MSLAHSTWSPIFNNYQKSICVHLLIQEQKKNVISPQ